MTYSKTLANTVIGPTRFSVGAGPETAKASLKSPCNRKASLAPFPHLPCPLPQCIVNFYSCGIKKLI